MFILQLEEGQFKMQSRLEEEEDAKAALMSRIQRLTKLILVSSKNAMPGYMNDMASHQRSLSAAEDEVSCYSHLLISQGMFKQMYLLYSCFGGCHSFETRLYYFPAMDRVRLVFLFKFFSLIV